MLLACPNCNTVFRIEKTAIGSGRKVNCGVCKNVWIATQENLMEEKKVSENAEKFYKEKNSPLKDKTSESKTKILQNEIDKKVINKPLISKEINMASEFKQKKTKIPENQKFHFTSEKTTLYVANFLTEFLKNSKRRRNKIRQNKA